MNNPNKSSPLSCRIINDIEPRDNVRDVIDGMLEWYNGFEFLWRAGGWQDDVEIPDEYKSAFDLPQRMHRLGVLHGINSYTAEHPEIMQTACIMQVARWFTGHFSHKVHKWHHEEVYNQTARCLARGLGYDTYEQNTDWPDRIISYNDTPGRTFQGIIDLLKSAKLIIRYDNSFNYQADHYSHEAIADLQSERDNDWAHAEEALA